MHFVITIVINVNDICNMKLLKVFIARQMLQWENHKFISFDERLMSSGDVEVLR